MAIARNYALNAFPPSPPAPRHYYLIALAIGLVSGALMEWTIVKSDYYQDSELRERKRKEFDRSFYQEYVKEQQKKTT